MQKSRTIELSDYRNAPLNFQAFLLYDFDMFFVGSYSSRVIFVPHRVGNDAKRLKPVSRFHAVVVGLIFLKQFNWLFMPWQMLVKSEKKPVS